MQNSSTTAAADRYRTLTAIATRAKWGWAILVELYLADGQMYFAEIEDTLGIPRATLSHTLKALEAAGLVNRIVNIETRPARVSYALIASNELNDVLAAMDRFIETNP